MATAVDDRIDLEEPVSGVVVLPRGEFDRLLAAAYRGQETDDDEQTFAAPVDDATVVRAAELAGRSNEPGVVGIAARVVPGGRVFASSLFVVADTIETDPLSDRIVVTSFDVAAIELSGTSGAWFGVNASLALGSLGGAPRPGGSGAGAQPGRCCGPSVICVPTPTPPPGGGDPVAEGPAFRFSLAERVAVSAPIPPLAGPGPPGFGTAGDYGTRAGSGGTPVGLLPFGGLDSGLPPLPEGTTIAGRATAVTALDCVQVRDPSCGVAHFQCGPGDVGFTTGSDGSPSLPVGSNPCGAPFEMPVRANNVPAVCTYVFAPEYLAERCLGRGSSLSQSWGTLNPLTKMCGVAMTTPGATGPCNPQTPTERDIELKKKGQWTAGLASKVCDPVGPRGAGERCVECDKDGHCAETIHRLAVEPELTQEKYQTIVECVGCDKVHDPPPPAATIRAQQVVDSDKPTPQAQKDANGAPPPIVQPASTTPPSPTPPGPATSPQPSGTPLGPFTPGKRPNDLVALPSQRADPVDLSDGALSIEHVDLAFPGPVRELRLARSYSSTSADRSPLGSNWSHNWDERLEPITATNAPDWLSPWSTGLGDLVTAVLHHRGDGGADAYLFDAVTTLFLPHAGAVSTLARMDGGWAMRDPDGRLRTFDAAGYLIRDVDRFGNAFDLVYEPTPLGRLFEAHCAPAARWSGDPLSHRRYVLLAYLVGAIERPPPDPQSWQVIPGDFDHDIVPSTAAEQDELAYARDYLRYLSSRPDLPENVDGGRRQRVTSVTDPVGRVLSFSYVRAASWDQNNPSPSAFAQQPDAGLLQRVDGPGGTSVRYGYDRPSGYPDGLNEQFLVDVHRVDAAGSDPGLAPAASRSYQFTYAWPGGAAETYVGYQKGVQQAYRAYFDTFVGCLYQDDWLCRSGARGSVPRFNAGNPRDLARRAAEAYIGAVADDIVTVSVNGRLESETRYAVDPADLAFGRVRAQRYGSSTSAGPFGSVPPDAPAEQWTSTLPKAVMEWFDAGPTALDAGGRPVAERTELALPAELRERYPLENAPPPQAPPSSEGPTKPIPAGVCDLDATLRLAQQLPGWRPTVSYYDDVTTQPRLRWPWAKPPVSDLRRTWLTRDQLIAVQVGDPTHNDLSYGVAPVPGDQLNVFVNRVVGRRGVIAANANRICGWLKFTNRDGLVTWTGVNYRGQELVLAEVDLTGTFRFTESRYNADGAIVAHRPPAPVGVRAPRTTTWTYNEVDATANQGWDGWLPAYWSRRGNVLRTETSLAEPLPADDLETSVPTADATGPVTAPTLGRFVNTVWEPLFNQPMKVESGAITAVRQFLRVRAVDVVTDRTDFVYDYQELTLKVPPDDPTSVAEVLETLRPWGFPWLIDDADAMTWQLPVALLGFDVNADGALGNRFADTPSGGVAPSPAEVAARRGVGVPVAVTAGDPRTPDSARTWFYSWSRHGLPARAEGPDGELTRRDYYPGDPADPDGAFGHGSGAITPAVDVGYRGMLARVTTRTHRPGFPEGGGAVTQTPLSGPYRWLPVTGLSATSTPADVTDALAALGLPVELVTDLLATLTIDADPPTVLDTVDLSYNIAGHVMATAHAGRVTTRITDTDGRPTQDTDAAGTRSAMVWDRFGNAVSGTSSDATGQSVAEWAAGYDEDGQVTYLVQATAAGGSSNPGHGLGLEQTWRYRPEGSLERHIDAAGLVTEAELDGWGRLHRETVFTPAAAERRIRTATWTVDDRPESVRYGGPVSHNLPNLVEAFTFDALGRISTHTDLRGVGWAFSWSGRDQRTRIRLGTDAGAPPDWEQITAYDPRGRPQSVTVVGTPGPGGAPRTVVAEQTWSLGGQLRTAAADGFGAVEYATDLLGRPVWSRGPDGVETVRTYGNAPYRVCEAAIWAAADGTRRCCATVVELDTRGLPVTITSTARDGAAGNEHRITTTRHYDATGRLRSQQGPLGERTAIDWDWAGRVLQQTEIPVAGPPATAVFVTRPDGRLQSRTDPDGQFTVITYNGVSEVVDIAVDGFHQSFTRDRLGRIRTMDDGVDQIRITYAEGPGVPVGDAVLEEVERGGLWVLNKARHLDAFGRVTFTEARNLGLAATVGVADRTVLATRGYDYMGRTISEKVTVGTAPPILRVDAWTPLLAGGWSRERSLTCAGNTSSVVDGLDPAGRLDSRAPNGAPAVTFDWEGSAYRGRIQPQVGWDSPFVETVGLDPFGLATGVTCRTIDLDGSGTATSAADAARWAPPSADQSLMATPLFHSDQARDRIGRLGAQWSRVSTPAAGARTHWWGAGYDGNRRLERWLDSDALSAAPTLPAYGADSAAVAAVAPAGSEDWAYQRNTVSGDVDRIVEAGGATRFDLTAPRDTAHRLTQLTSGADAVTVTHDAAARIAALASSVSGATSVLLWHPGGALAGLADNGVLDEGHLYDGFGRLAGLVGGTAGPPRRLHGFDGADLVTAYDGAGAPAWEAMWGPTQLIAVTDLASGTQTIPVVDQVGSPVAFWQPNGAGLAGTVTWTPEGRSTVFSANGGALCGPVSVGSGCDLPGGVEFGFAGTWQSPSTGLNWMGARWYSAGLGQFVSPDPLMFIDSANRYTYVADDPLNHTDPRGMGKRGLADPPAVPPGEWDPENIQVMAMKANGETFFGTQRQLDDLRRAEAATRSLETGANIANGLLALGALGYWVAGERGARFGANLSMFSLGLAGRAAKTPNSAPPAGPAPRMPQETPRAQRFVNPGGTVIVDDADMAAGTIDLPPESQPPKAPATVVNPPAIQEGAQGKHILYHNNYIPGKSILSGDAEKLAPYTGAGTPVGSAERGTPGFIEILDFGQVIGYDRPPGQPRWAVPTTTGKVHYNNAGEIHIVPTTRSF